MSFKTFPDYYVIKHTDYIEARNLEGALLGFIQGSDVNEDWAKIENGANPIREQWEDSSGHTCTLQGWGTFYAIAYDQEWVNADEDGVTSCIDSALTFRLKSEAEEWIHDNQSQWSYGRLSVAEIEF